MFGTLLEISLTTSLIIALLLIFMPFLSKRYSSYSSKWRYLIWLFKVYLKFIYKVVNSTNQCAEVTHCS